MRVLVFNKDHPKLNTGYSKCLKEYWINRLSKNNDISVYATIPSTMFFDEYNGIKIYTGSSEKPCDIINGEPSLLNVYNQSKADLYFTQVDSFVFDKTAEYAKEGKINWVAYIPLDFEPIPQYLKDRLKYAKAIITMSKWAKDQLKDMPNVVDFVYHGVDTNIFRPLGISKKEIREKYPNYIIDKDGFLITLVQKNAGNKALIQQLEGIKLFRERNPDLKLKIYFHTFPKGQFEIVSLLNFFKLEDITILCDPYKYLHCLYDDNHLNLIYNLADVNLNASAEGFGLPTIEAMASGTPTIGLNWGTTKELLENITPELLVRVGDKELTNKYVWKILPSAEDIANKLDQVRKQRYDIHKLHNFAKETFSWDQQADKINKIIKAIDLN